MGRAKGSFNRGVWYRKGRGWYTGKGTPLLDADGHHIKDRQARKSDLHDALERVAIQQTTTATLASAYLRGARISQATHRMRAYVFERLPFAEQDPHTIKPQQLDKLTRIQAQALRRMFNWAHENGQLRKKISVPIPPAGARVTCLSPEQEQSLLAASNATLRDAIRVLIRTGMRPSEFCLLSKDGPRRLVDHGNRMEIRFAPAEVKTRRARIVRVTDKEVISILRKGCKNRAGGAWRVRSLSGAFLRARRRAERDGASFDADCCLYSCRHTFAKRVLTGYWTGKPCSIEVLATLMGNSPAICRRYYLEWADEYTEPLWQAV
jgi:integrase